MFNSNMVTTVGMDFLLYLQNIREATPDWITNVLFYFSDFTAGAVALIAIAIIYWSVDKKHGSYMFVSYCSAIFANNMIKAAACVYRPWILNPEIRLASVAVSTATGYSFPSGHSTLAANFFTSLSIWPEKSSKKLTIFCIMATILAAFARNWVGAHSPMDVLIGISSGIIIAFLALNFLAVISRRKNMDIYVTVAVLVLSAAAFIWLCLKSWPMDYNPDGTLIVDPVKMSEDAFKAAGVMVGCFCGWFVERRFIGFSTDVPLKKKILRISVALPIMVAALVLFSFIGKAMGPRWGNLTAKAVLIFLATGGIPFLFRLKTFN